MRASECPASNCSISSLILAAIKLLFGGRFFAVDGRGAVGGVGYAAHGVVSFAVAFAFHAVASMYLHAERLLAKAGGSKCKERGITHS